MVLHKTAGEDIPELERYQRQFLTAGAAGAVVSLIGYFQNPTQFFQSYLMAYMFVLGLSLGSLALGMVHQLSGGAWGVVIRRQMGAASRVLPIVTVLFLPIIFGMPHLYEWTHADVVANDPILQGKQAYLNTPFFLARAAFYFVVWNGLAFQIVMLSWLSKRKPMSDALTPTYLGDLAGLMFAFVVLWAYMSFSQYLIIWSGNLPEEIMWYLHRMQGGWVPMGIVLVVFHFALPFFLLLMRGIKRRTGLVSKVAIAIIFARLLDLFWLIAPETHHDGLVVSWMDIVIPVTLFALFVGLYLQQLRQRPLLPVNDPQFEEALGPVLAHGANPGTAH